LVPASVRSRASDLCLFAATITIAACAPAAPAAAPASIPAPVADARSEEILDSRSEAAATPSKAAKAKSPSPVAKRPAVAKRPVVPKPPASIKSPNKRAPRVRVDSAALERAATQRHAYTPLARALAARTRDPELADRVAAALVSEAERLRLSPSLLAGVLLIENAPLDTAAVSTQGAIGLMQVMPLHAGGYGCGSADLVNVETNICHGARLLKTFVRRTGSVHLALRRYNGCSRGRNTPRCYRYPSKVLRTASRVRHELLLAAADLSGEPIEDQLLASSESSDPDSAAQESETDSTTSASSSATECATLFGCLRSRWSLTR